MTAPIPLVQPDEVRDWYFTFGFDHTHPATGERLAKRYVKITDTCDGSRAQMMAVFGNRWANQYLDAERAGVSEYDLTEISLSGEGAAVADACPCGDYPDAACPEHGVAAFLRAGFEDITPATDDEAPRCSGLSLPPFTHVPECGQMVGHEPHIIGAGFTYLPPSDARTGCVVAADGIGCSVAEPAHRDAVHGGMPASGAAAGGQS